MDGYMADCKELYDEYEGRLKKEELLRIGLLQKEIEMIEADREDLKKSIEKSLVTKATLVDKLRKVEMDNRKAMKSFKDEEDSLMEMKSEQSRLESMLTKEEYKLI